MAGIMEQVDSGAPSTGNELTQAGQVASPGQPIGTDVMGPSGFQYREAESAQRQVDPTTGTASGQLNSILAGDGVHMQRARANALSMAADMGLRNSSMAVGASQGAMIDRATPIAQTDAGIYDTASRDNQAAKNQTNIANANNYNQLGGIMVQQAGDDKRLASQQQFQAGQANQDRTLQNDLQNGRISADSVQQQLTRDQQTRLQQLQESGMDSRQASTIAAQERQQREQNVFSAGESQLGRTQQAALQTDQQRFAAAQAILDKSFTSAENSLNRDQQAALQAGQQQFQATQSAQDRTLQTDLQSGRLTADAVQQQLSRDQQSRIQQLQEAGMDSRQASTIAAQEKQQREQNVFASAQQTQQQQFAAGQAILDKSFTSAENSLNRDQQAALQAGQQAFQAGQANQDRTLQNDLQSGRINADAVQQQLTRDQQTRTQQLQEAGMDARQAGSIAAQEKQQREQNVFNAAENQAGRDQQMSMFDKTATQAEKTAMTAHTNALAQMGFSNDLAKANIPANFAASIASATMNSINAINADGNLDPTAKKAAIQNVIDTSAATASLGEKLYGVKMPSMAMPGGGIMGPQQPAAGSSATQPSGSNYNYNGSYNYSGYGNGTDYNNGMNAPG